MTALLPVLLVGVTSLAAVTYLPAIVFRMWAVSRMRKAAKGKLVLTYDDGPSMDCPTPQILETLARHRARATFFQLGRNVAAGAQMSDRLIAEGHEIGAHSVEHLNAWKRPLRSVMDQTEGLRAVSRWTAAGGSGERLYRPPYGKSTTWTLLAGFWLRSKPVWWTIDSRDTWAATTAVETVVSELDAAGGGVLLLHDFPRERDSKRSHYTVELTDEALKLARRRGWTVCTASELLSGRRQAS